MPSLRLKVQFVRRVERILKRDGIVNQFPGLLTATLTAGGITITIAETMIFEIGRGDIRSEALPVIEALSEVLSDNSAAEIRVQGHTDNVPIRSMQFPSNWELAAIRAVRVVRVLTELYGVPAERMSATGFGEFRAVVDNLSTENRAKNRRVELHVVLNEPEPSAQ